jgi:hypothetical protein
VGHFLPCCMHHRVLLLYMPVSCLVMSLEHSGECPVSLKRFVLYSGGHRWNSLKRISLAVVSRALSGRSFGQGDDELVFGGNRVCCCKLSVIVCNYNRKLARRLFCAQLWAESCKFVVSSLRVELRVSGSECFSSPVFIVACTCQWM